MNIIVRLLLWSLVISWFLVGTTRAQEVESGVGLICNEVAEIVAFNDAWQGSNEDALKVVNEKEPVCGVMGVAYYRGEKVGQVSQKGVVYDIVRIAVIAVNVGMGWMQGEPMVQYTLLASEKPEERGA